MQHILTVFAVLLLAGACANGESSLSSNDDPAGAIYGHGMVGAPPVLVPGTTTTVY